MTQNCESRFAAVTTATAWISDLGADASLERLKLFSSALAGRDTLSPAGDGLTTA
jgi:hypothetical protein